MSGTGRERRAGTTLLAVSLKMYFPPLRTVLWSEQVAEIARTHPAVLDGTAELVVLPSFPMLGTVRQIFAGTTVAVGAQDLHDVDRGAFTGAVSGADLDELGCRYVEVGHGERRRVFGDDDAMVNRKVRAAWRNDLVPIVCVGEDDAGPAAAAADFCVGQLAAALRGVEDVADPPGVVVAYEPNWTIGGARPAPLEHIAAVVGALRERLLTITPLAGCPVIYGGSAGAGLLRALGPAADGLFLGRSVHDAMALKPVLDETMRPR